MLVVDATIAVKWYVEQPNSSAAREIAIGSDILIAPDLILAEVGSALWKYCRSNRIALHEARKILERIPSHFESLISPDELCDEALSLAVATDHPIYDCFYLALASREQIPLITADRRLHAAATKLGSVEVQLLEA